MCGIVAYIGKKQAVPVLIEGLSRLEYRGYDSAGLTVFLDDKKGKKINHKTIKAVGRVKNLEKAASLKNLISFIGIAHTRWATHGKPSLVNAHPHSDCSGNIWLAHNGIVENYKTLKDYLKKKGHIFKSQTDTEIIAHLIEENFEGKLEEAVIKSLKQVRGTYGLVVISKNDPGKIVAARLSSPLLIALGDKEFFVASDASPVLAHTNKVVYLNDGDLAVISKDSVRFFNLENIDLKKNIEKVEWTLEESQKSGFKHFMLKEIFEQPQSIENAMRGRLIYPDGFVRLGGLEAARSSLEKAEKLVIGACGTAYLAGLCGKYMIENIALLPCETDLASEFRYRSPIVSNKDLFLAISQSGETADTLAALREAKNRGALSLGIINTVGSTISRETDYGIYNYAGPEIGVASTKAFTSQLTVIALLAVALAELRGAQSKKKIKAIVNELHDIPSLVKKIIKNTEKIKKIAQKYKNYNNFLYLGRKYNYPAALEGALKLKEISYIHAEGYAAGEMKHGPIALVDKNFPSVFIAAHEGEILDKIMSNMEEIKARGGPIIAVAFKENRKIEKIADDVIYIPKTIEMLTPILAVVPLQLFAYYIADSLGRDVDKPRNLAKSVTVE